MISIANRIARRFKRHLIARFLKKKNIAFDGIPLFAGPWPDINNDGKILIGANCFFRSFRLRHRITVKKNAELRIGDKSFLNDGVTICATQSIIIGQNARIGDMTFIYDTDFHEIAPELPMRQMPVVIGNNVWIGVRSIILPGSVINDHCVIAAGSTVTGEVPAKSLAAGSPARVIKTLTVPDGWLRA